jgi:hypothetical protein
LRRIINEKRMKKFITVEREVNRVGENESNKGVDIGTNSDRQIRAFESDPQNTFNLKSSKESRKVKGRVNSVFPIVTINPRVTHSIKVVIDTQTRVRIQNLFGTDPVRLSSQEAYPRRMTHIMTGNSSERRLGITRTNHIK